MDVGVYEQAVLMHKDRVHSYASMMLRNAEEARDVAQESLVRLWEHRGRVTRDQARPWLLRTAHNLCIDYIRKRSVRGEVDGENVIPMRPDAAPGPLQLVQSDEMGRAIEAALGELPPRDRAAVIMREVQGLPYDEIARTLELPLGTLKACLHRARERLRRKLLRSGVAPRPLEEANGC